MSPTTLLTPLILCPSTGSGKNKRVMHRIGQDDATLSLFGLLTKLSPLYCCSCWNDSIVDLFLVVRPDQEQIENARSEAQTDYFTASWRQDQARLYQDYVSEIENPTFDNKRLVFKRASGDATGGEGCEENFAGTAWFWFTIMTTVGKEPITMPAFSCLPHNQIRTNIVCAFCLFLSNRLWQPSTSHHRRESFNRYGRIVEYLALCGCAWRLWIYHLRHLR